MEVFDEKPGIPPLNPVVDALQPTPVMDIPLLNPVLEGVAAGRLVRQENARRAELRRIMEGFLLISSQIPANIDSKGPVKLENADK